MVSRFDTTAAGRLRLILPTVFEILEVEDTIYGNGKRDRDDSCEWCNGSHPSNHCWQKYPNKKPEYVKKRELKSRPKFSFGAAKDEMSMITMWWEDTKLEEGATLLMDDGRPYILVDTAASNLLFLLTDRTALDDFRVLDIELRTAQVKGILKIMGTGKIGQQSADWSPMLRRSIISLGRLHSWNCSLFMLVNCVSEIHTPHKRVLLGKYVRGRPVFAMDDIFYLARQQPFDNNHLAIQGMPPEDERPTSPIGNLPSDVGSGSVAIQGMPPEGERPASPIGNLPSDVGSGSLAIQGMPPEDERPASPIGNLPSDVGSGSLANQGMPPEVPTVFSREAIRGMPPVVTTAVSRVEINLPPAGYGQKTGSNGTVAIQERAKGTHYQQ
jgi:hypothetical protein